MTHKYNKITIIKVLLLASLTAYNTGCKADQNNLQEIPLPDYIADSYLTSNFGKKEIIEPVQPDTNNLSFFEKFKLELKKNAKIVDTQKRTLTNRESQEVSFDLTKVSFQSIDSALDQSAVDKLELIGGGENKDLHLFSTLFNDLISTSTGKAQLALTLCHPITNSETLKNRQQVIHLLSSSPKKIGSLESIFKQIHVNEQKTLSYWHNSSVINEEMLKSFYFNTGLLKKCNSYTLPLETWNKGMISFYMTNAIMVPMSIAYGINKIAKQNNTNYVNAIKLCRQSIKDICTEAPQARPILIGYATLLTAATALNSYTAHAAIKSTAEGTNHLQDILISTADYIQQLKNLSTFVNQNKTITQSLPSLQPLADFNNPKNRSAKLNKLIAMLETNTFKGEPSFFSITGRILAAHKLMQEIKDELAPVFAAAGELEMYTAIAKLYNSREGKEARYCMVDFVENSTTPIIDAKGFWNPFINPDNVVINDIAFDTSCPNSILTGPNTGGKSTVIKGIMLNVLFAQTFGIAPSQKLRLTPFTKLNCFMNISDDIATGASLFKSEVMRAKKLLDMVQELQQNEFSFVIIDEVFTGTSPKEGESAALKFSEKLGSYPNNISIIATHYPQMTTLEEKTAGIFKNHHIEILRNEDGSLNRTFKLKNGPTFFNVAFDILEEEGLFV